MACRRHYLHLYRWPHYDMCSFGMVPLGFSVYLLPLQSFQEG